MGLWVYGALGRPCASLSERSEIRHGRSATGMRQGRAGRCIPIISHRAGWFVFVRPVVGSETSPWSEWPLTPTPFWLSACQWKWPQVPLRSLCDGQHELSQHIRFNNLWLSCWFEIALCITIHREFWVKIKWNSRFIQLESYFHSWPLFQSIK